MGTTYVLIMEKLFRDLALLKLLCHPSSRIHSTPSSLGFVLMSSGLMCSGGALKRSHSAGWFLHSSMRRWLASLSRLARGNVGSMSKSIGLRGWCSDQRPLRDPLSYRSP